MNQIRDWDGSCQRCYNKTDVHTMSIFDVSLICIPCKDSESKHPNYAHAYSAEIEAVKSGNYNFKGVGYERTEKNESG